MFVRQTQTTCCKHPAQFKLRLPVPADLHTLFTKHIQPRTRTLRRDRDVPVIVPQELLLSQINHVCFDSLLIPEFSDSFSINPTVLLSLEQSEADGRVELSSLEINEIRECLFVRSFSFLEFRLMCRKIFHNTVDLML